MDTIDKTCTNYKYQQVTPPNDLKYIVACYEGHIVWSRTKSKHQVRYGLEVNEFKTRLEAAHNFGETIAHNAECNGLM